MTGVKPNTGQQEWTAKLNQQSAHRSFNVVAGRHAAGDPMYAGVRALPDVSGVVT